MGGKFKKSNCPQNVGEGEGPSLRDQLENCLKMHYFQLFPEKFYDGEEFSDQKM